MRPITIEQTREIQSFVRELLIALGFSPEEGDADSLPDALMPVTNTEQRVARDAFENYRAAGPAISADKLAAGTLAADKIRRNTVERPTLIPDVAELPAANSVPDGTRRRLRTDGKVYESNGEVWSAYAIGSGAVVSVVRVGDAVMNQQTAERILTEVMDAIERGTAGPETPLTDEQRLAAKEVAGVLTKFAETILVLAGGLSLAATHGDVVETNARLDDAVGVLGS